MEIELLEWREKYKYSEHRATEAFKRVIEPDRF
jgi:hypothetical protein